MSVDGKGNNSNDGAGESGYLEAYWNDFHEHAVGLDATPEQLFAARRAFHAGALSLLRIINDLGTVVLSSDEGAASLNTVATELEQFFADYMAGDA